VRQSGRRVAARQQIANTRRIIASQQPTFPDRLKPAQQQAYIKVQRQRDEQASRRAAQIAFQHIAQLQARTPNPKVATESAIRQTYEKFHTASEIGRLTKVWTNPKVPLEHRVGALRALRNRYGVPVTQANYKAFRQAQRWHEFLHDGKEGDTFTLPEKFGGSGLTLDKTQTYQLRRKGGKIVPVAVYKDRTGFDVLTGRKPHWFEQKNRRIYNAPNIATGFTQAGVDTAHYGAKLIPEGAVGTPLRKAITEITALGPNTITGAYGLGSAVVQAATGNRKPLSELAKSFATDDPVGRLVTHGDFKAFAAHPGIALAEVVGGLGAVDRIGGRVARHGAPPEVRNLRGVPITRLARQDRYSKGLVTARVQKARDAKVAARFNELRDATRTEVMKAHAAQAAGDMHAATGHLQKARQLATEAERFNAGRVRETTVRGPHRHIAGPTDLERLGDVTEGTNQFAQRAGRTEVLQQLLGKHAVRESKRRAPVVLKGAEGEVQGLIAEGRVAPHRAELERLARRVAGQEKYLHDHHQIATNRHLVQSITEVLHTHSDAELRLLGDEAHRYARLNRAVHEEAHAADILDREEARMSSLKAFAVEQMGALPNAEGKLVLKHEGGERVLTAPQIEKAMNAYADKHPGALRAGEQAFISHSSRIGGPGSYNIRADSAKGLPRARRTGTAVLFGTASVGREAMLGSVVKLRNMVTAARSFRNTIEDAAGRDPKRMGGVIAENSSKAALARWNELMTDHETGLPRPGQVEGVAVRLNPFGGRESQLQRTLFEADEEGFLPGQAHPLTETLQSALRGEDVGSGPWTVIPKAFADRLIEHAGVSRGAPAAVRSLNNAFRKAILPWSPTWITGNLVEGGVRATVAGWRPGDAALEERVLANWAKLDADKAERFALSIGSGHFGSVPNWTVRATANSIHGGQRAMHEVAEKILEAERLGKPVRWGADAIRGYTNFMMETVNGTLESGIKHGMVGTAMRQYLLPRDLGAKTAEAAEAIAQELHRNPAAAEEMVRLVQRMYGAYEHFSPDMRKILTVWTPFGAWVFNAVKFLTTVLPADHPGLVALMAANDSATRQYRRDNGLDATLAGDKNSGQVPPFLTGSIPTPAWYARLTGTEKGAPLRLARYTPLGLLTDPTSSIASSFIPQLPLEALQGRDFTGRELRNKDGSPFDSSQQIAYFTQQFVLSTTPAFGLMVRVGQRGPGALNPLQPVARKKQQSKSRSSSGGFGGMPGTPAGSSSFGGLPG
jgi:hypothetical protein